MRITFCLILALFPTHTLFSYPEMLRHGYSNCNTCHVSPSGGGITTAYGKALSQEVLSVWKIMEEDDTGTIHSILHPTDWLLVGGHYRSIFAYNQNIGTQSYKSNAMNMQADLELALVYKRWKLVGTIGKEDFRPKDKFLSRRHYLSYQATNTMNFRLGRFQYAYGLNVPDHKIPTKERLNMSHAVSGETYNAEVAYLGERFNLYLTGIIGQDDYYKNLGFPNEQGLSIKMSYLVVDTMKLGWSAFYGKQTKKSRYITGPFSILAFTPKLFLLSEIDLKIDNPKSQTTNYGLVQYARLNYEIIQGLHVYLAQDIDYFNLKKRNYIFSYSLGSQLFPLSHIEINMQWQRKKVYSQNIQNKFWLMTHFYL